MKTPSREFHEIVRRALSGSIPEQIEILSMVAPTIKVVIARYLEDKCSEDIADNMSNINIKIMENLSKLRHPSSFKSWVCTIARNVVLNFLDKSKGEVYVSETTLEAMIEKVSESPEDKFIREERKRIILELIQELPKGEKNAILFHYFEDLTFREIAELENARPETVEVRAVRGRRRLGNLIAENYPEYAPQSRLRKHHHKIGDDSHDKER